MTEAVQYVIDHGAKIKVLDVARWHDAGEVDTLLETNRVILKQGRARRRVGPANCTIVEPVYIEDGVTLTGSTIGPNASIAAGCSVTTSVVRDSIIGGNARLVNCTLSNSMIGDRVTLAQVRREVTVGDDAEVHGVS